MRINATSEIKTLYLDKIGKNGNRLIRVAKLAPAPIRIKAAGNAQQIRVDDEANKDRRLADLSFTVGCQRLIDIQDFEISDILSVRKDLFCYVRERDFLVLGIGH